MVMPRGILMDLVDAYPTQRPDPNNIQPWIQPVGFNSGNLWPSLWSRLLKI